MAAPRRKAALRSLWILFINSNKNRIKFSSSEFSVVPQREQICDLWFVEVSMCQKEKENKSAGAGCSRPGPVTSRPAQRGSDGIDFTYQRAPNKAGKCQSALFCRGSALSLSANPFCFLLPRLEERERDESSVPLEAAVVDAVGFMFVFRV